MKGVDHRGIGVVRGVVRGVTTGEAMRLKVVGLITPLIALNGLILGYVNIWRVGNECHVTWRNYNRYQLLVNIRKEAHIKPIETFPENKRLKWFGHCLRQERNHVCAKSLILEVSGRMSRGRPRTRRRDNIQRDMKKYRLTEDMAQDRKY